ncbi:helix-turn-helix domain-containing protein [Alkaliphilus oremlandii]|uniref:Transcriptional regulator, XRE family n=1 Tax=Alkaliphilus oremlandii (strain OhILAs) TaxID=350688 RepID=A8MHS9_ALKOO|nr:helix-turn-helix domain-containing protein [Alkaliphilus oremlandii]ABW19361.1 transcriptional regulator, XRE family [Alkaliphilus oremlandii OhILAs]
MTFGKRLKKLREEKSWQLEKVAKYLKVSIATVSNYERDFRKPDIDTINKIADLFEVTSDYLIGRTSIKDAILLENEDLPKELKEIGIEYLEVNKELKKKGLSPEDILDIIEAIEKTGLRKRDR